VAKQNTYLVYGTENYLIEEGIAKLTASLIPKEERDLNVVTYDLINTPVEEIVQEAESPPFFGQHKLIIAKNAWLFTAQKVKGVEHNLIDLERLLVNPVDYSTIVFWVPYEKIDERRKIVKQLKKNALVKSFNALTGTALVDWVKKQAVKEKATITDEGANLLIHLVGDNMQILVQEIKKLATYVDNQGIISEETVQSLGIRSTEQNIFSLIESVANLKIDQAFRLFYDLLQNKEEPIKMIALFARQFRLMLYAKELDRMGYSSQQTASQLGAHPYAIKLALEQSRKFTETQLAEIIKELAKMDYQVKTGQMDKVLSLEMFMFYLNDLVV